MTTIIRNLGILGIICGGLMACAADTDGEDLDEPTAEENVASIEQQAAGSTKLPFVRGDINYDGEIDMTDATLLANLAFGGHAVICNDAADVDGDNEITTDDFWGLYNYLNGGEQPAGIVTFSGDVAFPGAALERPYLSQDGELCGDDTILCETDDDCTAPGFSCNQYRNYNIDVCSETKFLRGDVNADGQVDITDLQTLYASLADSSVEIACNDAADVNDDGRIDISDRIAFVNWYSNGTFDMPAPNTQTGAAADPTADGLGCRDIVEPGDL
jgi:hypothetical protein